MRSLPCRAATLATSAAVGGASPALRWKPVGQVEKASRAEITKLVQTTEAIIGDERKAWMSTAQLAKKEGDGEGRRGKKHGHTQCAAHTVHLLSVHC